MAHKAQGTAVATKQSNQSLTTIDAELANEVASLKEQIGQPSGRSLKVKPNGDIETPEGQNLGPEIQVVVVDFVSSNRLYLTRFDPQNPSPPDCYAIGRKLVDMKPESDSPSLQSPDGCNVCPMNQFGSGDNGKGKACRNKRDLAVLILDPENPEAHNDPSAPIYILSVAPTSIKSFDGFVGGVARTLGPPVKAIVTIRTEVKGTYSLTHFVDPLANPDYGKHVARRPEVQDTLFRKPDFSQYNAKPARNAPAARTAAAAPRRAPARR